MDASSTTVPVIPPSDFLIADSHMKLVLAFLVGAIGSAAYITALYFKFIGDTDGSRTILMRPFTKFKYNKKTGLLERKMNIGKCVWYCFIGGCIAVIFQFDVPNFVSVQSLILGATWPAIVSQFLSGRMANPSQKELEDIAKPQPYDVSSMRERIKGLSEK